MSDNSIRVRLQWAAGLFDSVSDSPRLDAELLLAHCLRRERSYLLAWPERELDADQRACFEDLARRRLQPQPVAYLVGHREFYSMPLAVTAATLVPRPETELLVDGALEELAGRPEATVLDLGTGSGAIALAIKQHCPHCRVTATDIDEATLQVARDNARQLNLAVELLLSDWFSALPDAACFDLIVSNPPYIAEHDPYLVQGDLPAEPRRALVSGVGGLDALRRIVADAPSHLRPGGLLLLEHGWEQAAAVADLMRAAGFVEVETRRDFNDLQRATQGRWKP